MSDKVKTRFLLLSDTHSSAPNLETWTSLPCRWPLPEADVAIHTGDLTMTGKIHEHERAIDLLKRLRADLKIVIPGNHDLTLDDSYYAEKGDLWGPRPKYTTQQLQQIRDMYTGSEAKAANIIYLEEGTRTFKLKNGASLKIYASAYTPEFCDWAFAYPRDVDRFNSNDSVNPVEDYRPTAEDNVDVILTHGPPSGILDEVDDKYGRGKIIHVGCEHLFRAVSRVRPLLHCFGHIHEGWGAVRKQWPEASKLNELQESNASVNCSPVVVDVAHMIENMGVHVDITDVRRGDQTLFVNASIMDIKYKPRQGPWIVDVLLNKIE